MQYSFRFEECDTGSRNQALNIDKYVNLKKFFLRTGTKERMNQLKQIGFNIQILKHIRFLGERQNHLLNVLSNRGYLNLSTLGQDGNPHSHFYSIKTRFLLQSLVPLKGFNRPEKYEAEIIFSKRYYKIIIINQ